MPDPFGDINSPYYSSLFDDKKFSSAYEGQQFGLPQSIGQQIPSEDTIEPRMDNVVEQSPITTSAEASSEIETPTAGGFFESILGEGVNIYDSQSIADSLMAKYGIEEGLTPGMFPAMSRDLMAASLAPTYDAYKRMMINPEQRKYREAVSRGAGLLNRNKQRQRARRALSAGIQGVTGDIFKRTSFAKQGIRDWLQNALRKVRNLKY